MDDNAIVDLYWQRDEAAVRETETKYGRYLTKIAFNILSDREDSRESVNDVYFKAWNSMPPHRPGILSAYLGRLARQTSIDIYRRKTSEKRRGGEYALSLSELDECVTDNDTPEKSFELRQLTDAVCSFLRSLPEETRNVFICRYYFFDSIRDISSYTGAGEAKIKSMLFRTRALLRAHLQKEGFIQ